MRRRSLIIIVSIVVVLFFAPILPGEWVNPGGGGPSITWVSPSFLLFQCGSFAGGVTIEVPSGTVVGRPLPFWVASSNWNCQYLHPTWVQ